MCVCVCRQNRQFSCWINWIDLVFLVKHIDCIMKQAAQMKRNISHILSNISWGPLKADTSLVPPDLKWEQKHFIFDKWDVVFFWTFLLPRRLARVISVWAKLPNKWWRVWRRLLESMIQQVVCKPKTKGRNGLPNRGQGEKEGKPNFIEHLLCA